LNQNGIIMDKQDTLDESEKAVDGQTEARLKEIETPLREVTSNGKPETERKPWADNTLKKVLPIAKNLTGRLSLLSSEQLPSPAP
jgi:hypothetical protein